MGHRGLLEKSDKVDRSEMLRITSLLLIIQRAVDSIREQLSMVDAFDSLVNEIGEQHSQMDAVLKDGEDILADSAACPTAITDSTVSNIDLSPIESRIAKLAEMAAGNVELERRANEQKEKSNSLASRLVTLADDLKTRADALANFEGKKEALDRLLSEIERQIPALAEKGPVDVDERIADRKDIQVRVGWTSIDF